MSTTRTRGRRAIIAVSAVSLVAGLFAASAAATAAAPAAAPAPSAVPAAAHHRPHLRWPADDPNLYLQVHAGPESPVAGARVQVRNAKGKLVGSGRTDKGGYIKLRVERGATPEHPYKVRTIGGKIHGRAFEGHVVALVNRVGLTPGPRFVDLATTVATRFDEKYDSGTAAAERKFFRRLGIDSRFGHDHLRLASYDVDRRALERVAANHGGFDGLVDRLVRAIHRNDPMPKLSTDSLKSHAAYHHTRSTRSTRSSAPVTSQACGAQTLPAPSSSTDAAIGVYSAEMAVGLVSAYFTKDPSLLLNGVAGMVFSNTAGMTNQSMLASLQAQLGCISQQILAVYDALQDLKLQVSVASAATCEGDIQSAWADYESLVNGAVNNPDDPTYQLTTANHSFILLLDEINNMNNACGSIINTMLFNSQAGQTAAWPTLLSNYKSGMYSSGDKAAFVPGTVNALAMFLQYWGGLMYQQSALMNDWYNADLTLYGNDDSIMQASKWGNNGSANATACMTAASLSNLNQTSTSWCQWQQNIIDVWPGQIYSDEVGDWDMNPASTSSYALSGSAVSAVPGGWGSSTTGYNNDPQGLTPSALGTHDLPNSTWNVANALASYNNQMQDPLTFPYQRYDQKSVQKTFSPTASQASGYYDLRDFFIGQLDSTVNSDGTVTACSSSCPQWMLLGSDGKTEMSTGGWTIDTPSCYDSWIANGNLYVYNTRYVHNAIYSPKPWSKDTSGGSIGGQTSSTNNNGSTVCAKVAPMAWLLARPWVQGGAWPATPLVSSPTTVARNGQLMATNCPVGSCTWSIVSPNVPAGLTLSPNGTFNWTGAQTGSVSVIVVAGNDSGFSPQVTVTVNLALTAPVITSPASVTNVAQLTATGCPSGGCSWSFAPGYAPIPGLTLSTTGKFAWAPPPMSIGNMLPQSNVPVVAKSGSNWSNIAYLTVSSSTSPIHPG